MQTVGQVPIANPSITTSEFPLQSSSSVKSGQLTSLLLNQSTVQSSLQGFLYYTLIPLKKLTNLLLNSSTITAGFPLLSCSYAKVWSAHYPAPLFIYSHCRVSFNVFPYNIYPPLLHGAVHFKFPATPLSTSNFSRVSFTFFLACKGADPFTFLLCNLLTNSIQP